MGSNKLITNAFHPISQLHHLSTIIGITQRHLSSHHHLLQQSPPRLQHYHCQYLHRTSKQPHKYAQPLPKTNKDAQEITDRTTSLATSHLLSFSIRLLIVPRWCSMMLEISQHHGDIDILTKGDKLWSFERKAQLSNDGDIKRCKWVTIDLVCYSNTRSVSKKTMASFWWWWLELVGGEQCLSLK